MQLGSLLSVGITMAGIYVALSCVCSFVSEQIAALLRLRGQKLYTGVLNLVFGNAALAQRIFRHTHVDGTANGARGLYRPGDNKSNRPSYIDPRNFSLAFWASVREHVTDLGNGISVDALQQRADEAARAASDAGAAAAQARNDADTAVANKARDADIKTKLATDLQTRSAQLADAAAKAQAGADAARAEDAKAQSRDVAADAAATAVNAATQAQEAAQKAAADAQQAEKNAGDLRGRAAAAAAASKRDPADPSLRQAAAAAERAAADAETASAAAVAGRTDAEQRAATAAAAASNAQFALALTHEVVTDPTTLLADLQQAAERIPDVNLRKNLATLFANAANDYESLLKATDDWFNAEMDRVSGWYRRQSQYILIAIAAVVVYYTGVDSLELVQRLYANPALVAADMDAVAKANTDLAVPGTAEPTAAELAAKDQLVKAAEGLLANENIVALLHPLPVDVFDWYQLQLLSPEQKRTLEKKFAADKKTADTTDARLRAARNTVRLAQIASAEAAEAARTNRKLASEAKQKADAESDARTALQSALSASLAAQDALDRDIDEVSPWFHFPGMFITFVALSLGGPFWFDALSSLVNVRMAGAKPATKPASPSASTAT